MQKTPPRFVPTLTQVIPAVQRTGFVGSVSTAAVSPASMPKHSDLSTEQIASQLRQQLLVRARQYMDVELQRRIRETISQLALEHAHKLFEELQPQLESAIHQVVEEAVAQAVAHASANPP